MKIILNSFSILALLFALVTTGMADVKVRQKMTMGGQIFETTKMIKKSRQRTEQKMDASLGAADFMSQVATITQCDMRRTLQVNDSKKIYFIEPFAEESDAPTEAAATGSRPSANPRRGGTVTITSSIKDTGERQTLFGLTARHLIITQEMESSADSCSGAGKTKMEIDGWYVDFSDEFNCPFEVQQAAAPQRSTKPDCMDRMIVRSSGGGKTGFMLNGTMKFYDAAGRAQMTQTIETLELSNATLADALFDVPQDYKMAASQQELYSMPNVADIMRQQNNRNDENDEANRSGQNNLPAGPGAKTVGLNITVAGSAKINQAEISRYLQNKLRENDLNARPGASGAGIDYVLNVEIKQVKESAAGKVGGLFGKVTGVETKAGKVDVELIITLTAPDSTTAITQSRVAKKFDGSAGEAVQSAIDEAMDKILAEIDN